MRKKHIDSNKARNDLAAETSVNTKKPISVLKQNALAHCILHRSTELVDRSHTSTRTVYTPVDVNL